jgi:hypothetical protein
MHLKCGHHRPRTHPHAVICSWQARPTAHNSHTHSHTRAHTEEARAAAHLLELAVQRRHPQASERRQPPQHERMPLHRRAREEIHDDLAAAALRRQERNLGRGR